MQSFANKKYSRTHVNYIQCSLKWDWSIKKNKVYNGAAVEAAENEE